MGLIRYYVKRPVTFPGWGTVKNRSFQRSLYLDDVTFMWFNNRVEEFADLDEAMGLDDGKNFNYDSNLDA